MSGTKKLKKATRSKKKTDQYNVNGFQVFSEFISVRDLGVLFGFGLFETIRIYNGIPFLLLKHLQRITNSLRELNFEEIPETSALSGLIYQYIKQHALVSRVLRLSITAGNKNESIHPSIFILNREIPYTEEEYIQGISAATASLHRRNEFSFLARHKTFNYLENLISLRACSKQNNKECIFLNTSGYISECSKSNIFFVKKNNVFTPSIDCGIFPGITREHVISLLKEKEITVIEGKFALGDLLSSEECFLTNSVMEIMPLVKIDDSLIGNGIPGKLTTLAADLYSESVGKTTKE